MSSPPHPSVISQPQQEFDLRSDSSVVMPILIGKYPSSEVPVSEADRPSSHRKVNCLKQPIGWQSARACRDLTQRFLDLDRKNGQQGTGEGEHFYRGKDHGELFFRIGRRTIGG